MKKYVSTFIFCFLFVSITSYAEENTVTEHIVTLEEKCSKNDYLSCFYAGQMFQKKNLMLLSITAYEKACSNKVYEACVNLADIYIKDDDKSVRKNAVKLYSEACDNNIARGCSALGHMYFTKNSTVNQSYKKSRKMFEKACNLLDKKSCYNAALMYEKGVGVKQNIDKAMDYFYRSCYMYYIEGCKKYNTLAKEHNG